MADTLPGDLVVQYQDAFQHFDTNHTGFIPTKQLGPLLRFCAENPSEAEIQVSESFMKFDQNFHLFTIINKLRINYTSATNIFHDSFWNEERNIKLELNLLDKS